MTPPPLAKVFCLTAPEPGKYLVSMVFDPNQPRVIDVKSDGSRVEVVAVTEGQLAVVLGDLAKMAAGWRS